ncbi:DinB family protein [Nocardioides anomalus]|uniref:DinB family protein n=1 Tax=Nocardioides anomalus TaxID=2712223 RepID=A0A6G6WIB3_9ACTN|nr:DinB family protein [Nocardioides anomalus]QIG44959.1 DinB family protein [Nocardioides anomalus]
MAEEFRERDLRGARFVESDLSGVVIRGSEVSGLAIDSPWLLDGDPVTVNGVDITGYVEGELNRRFPGRELWRATDPEGLREAWRAAVAAWDAVIGRAPEALVDEEVDGEWSFATTLRHLVHATDLWLGQSVLGWSREEFHPLGVGYGQVAEPAPYADVLAARASRVALVREFLADVTPEVLVEPRPQPHEPERTVTVCHCVQVVMEESWEHLRFAVRDLDALERA